MHFKEFINDTGMSLVLPSNIISGKIINIFYRTNPIKISIDTGKQIYTAEFPNRFLYDKTVGNQRPEIGKKAWVSLDHNNNIKNIEVAH